MGVVYEAEQASLGRNVAVKVLRTPSTLNSKEAKRFQREAHAAARLHHTNIVPVFGVGQQGDIHYYVMQLIDGSALDELLADIGCRREEASTTFGSETHSLGRPSASSVHGRMSEESGLKSSAPNPVTDSPRRSCR